VTASPGHFYDRNGTYTVTRLNVKERLFRKTRLLPIKARLLFCANPLAVFTTFSRKLEEPIWVSLEHLRENLSAAEIELTEDESVALQAARS
jgi:hypothetical protein